MMMLTDNTDTGSEAGGGILLLLMVMFLPSLMCQAAADSLIRLKSHNMRIYSADVNEIHQNSSKDNSKVPIRTDASVAFTWYDKVEGRQCEDCIYFKDRKKADKYCRNGKINIAVGHPKEYQRTNMCFLPVKDI